jgi:hypothetical protein
MMSSIVLTSELAAFCQRGVGIALASCESDGHPIAGRASGCVIDLTAQTVRLSLERVPNAALLQAVALGKGIAATFTQPSTHKSIQLKGASASLGTADADDARRAADQSAGFCNELVTLGYSESFSKTYCAFKADDLVTLIFVPTDGFTQTPGAQAGNALQS